MSLIKAASRRDERGEQALLERLALPHRLLSRPAVALVAVGLASASALLFGIAGAGRGGGTPFGFDGRFLEVAGAMWLRGANPYDARAFDSAARSLLGPAEIGPMVGADGFAYPPTAAPLALLLGAVPPRASVLLLGALNVAAALCVVLVIWRLLPARVVARFDVRAVAAIAVLGSPFVQHVLWMGQTTLVALAALLGGWFFGVLRGRVLLGGALLALSALKPQIVFIPLAWLLVERRWRLALATGVTALLFSIPAAIASRGPLSMTVDWMHALARYASGPVQTASFQHVFGVRSLLAVFGVSSGPSTALIGLSALGAGLLLWMGRERAGALGVLALTLSMSVLFVYAHDYDLAVLSPLLVFAWVETEEHPVAALALVLGVAVLFVPQRFLRQMAPVGGMGAIGQTALTGLTGHARFAAHAWVARAVHWREIVVLAMVAPSLLHVARVARVVENGAEATKGDGVEGARAAD